MSKTTVVLITGANKGLGLEFAKTFVGRPQTTLIAAVRQTTGPSTKDLDDLSLGSGSSIIKVRIDSVELESPKKAVESLKNDHGITHIDLAIANAGVSQHYCEVATASLQQLREHWEINTLGPVALFQSIIPLLEAAEKPKFVTLSTVFATIADMENYQYPTTAYGHSKAALDFITRKIHFEHSKLISFAISPGWVQTEQGNAGAKTFGMDQAPATIEESTAGMVKIIDKATRESTSGTFQSYDDTQIPW